MGGLELIRRLAKAGADLNARVTRKPSAGTTALNFVGGTAFFLAARTADVDMMRLLVDLGADPKLPNEDGTTPLMAAAGAGTYSPGEDPGLEPEALEAVKLTLALGNDVNVIDKNGNTVMHGAAYKQLPSVVKFLNEHGARVDVWNRKNSYDRLDDWHRKRYLVLPGMTGLWQVSGRSELDFDELVRLDFLYLERWSVYGPCAPGVGEARALQGGSAQNNVRRLGDC
jgi:hypothetical protein